MTEDTQILGRKYRKQPEGKQFPENAKFTLKMLRNVIETGNYNTTEKVIQLINKLIDEPVRNKPQDHTFRWSDYV